MVAIGAVYTGKTLFNVLTFQLLPKHMGNCRAEESLFPRESIGKEIFEFSKMMIEY